MQPLFKQIIFKTSVFTLVTACICLLTYLLFPELTGSYLFVIVAVMYAANLISFYVLIPAIEKKGSRFTNYFMILSFVKLIIYTTVVLLLVAQYDVDKFNLVLSFFILYILYSVFEINSLMRINHSSKQT